MRIEHGDYCDTCGSTDDVRRVFVGYDMALPLCRRHRAEADAEARHEAAQVDAVDDLRRGA